MKGESEFRTRKMGRNFKAKEKHKQNHRLETSVLGYKVGDET